MEKLKTNVLLELIDGIIIEYPNTKEYIQQKQYEKCDRAGIPIDKVVFFKQFQKQITNQARDKTSLKFANFLPLGVQM